MNYDDKIKSTRPLAVPFWDRLAPMKWFTFVIVTLINVGVVVLCDLMCKYDISISAL